MFLADSHCKLLEVVASVSKSRPKRRKEPKFIVQTAAKSSPFGAFSPNLATLVIPECSIFS